MRFDGGVIVKARPVGGWLLVLCILLTFVSPLVRAAEIIGGWVMTYDTVTNPFFGLGAIPLVHPVVVAALNTLVGIALIVMSIVAGLRLWRLRAGALRSARTFMLLLVAQAMLNAILTSAEAARREQWDDVGQTVRGVYGPAVFAAVWLSYLSRSKRVRETYPDQCI
jgi:hypothetical protein